MITLVSLIEGGRLQKGRCSCQPIFYRWGEVIEGDVHVDQFSIEEGANRRGSMLVNCFIKMKWNYWGGDTG